MASSVGATISAERAALQLGRHIGGGAEGAHTAGVRPGIAFAHALVVLGGAEGECGESVSQHEQARLLALQELLDHRFASAGEDGVERGVGFLAGGGHRHALARRQPVGLDHHGQAEGAVERGGGGGAVGRTDIAGGGDAGTRAQILGEALGALQLRRGPGRAEYRQPLGAQVIGKPCNQRRLWADHDQPDVARMAEAGHRRVIRDIQVREQGVAGDTRIARRGVEPI
jgi:hypothetical protein